PTGAERRLALGVALVAGFLYAGSLVGFRALNPFDVSWLRADILASHLAWEFVRQDPVTALPLLFTDQVGYPLVTSAAQFDVMPVVAIALLSISRVLPTAFQYLGPVQVFAAGALFYLGYALARGHGGTRLFAAGAGTLLMTNSVFTMRVGTHAALTAHCFLVWMIFESMRAASTMESPGPRGRSRRFERAWLVAIVTLGFNPYLAVMVTLLVVALGVQLVRAGSSSARAALVTGAVGVLALGASAWFFGYVGTGEDLGAPGFGEFSANLNTLVNPLVFSRFLPMLPVLGVGQQEGMAYLGLAGFVCAATWLVALRRSRELRASARSALPVHVMIVVMFAGALSNRVTLGNRVLFDVPLGDSVARLASVLRSSGRFSWPLFYLILSAGIAAMPHVIPRRLQGALGIALAALQLVELSPLRSGVMWSTSELQKAPMALRSPPWSDLGKTSRHLVVLPAWQCGPLGSPGGLSGFATFGVLAIEQKMTLNSYYSGRYGDAQNRYHCVRVVEELFRKGPLPDTAYVLSDALRTALLVAHGQSVQCVDADGFHLCTTRRAEPASSAH
ncbi:MAG TPA: DUF6311 domain-containing protein, partial [Polyangiaceae bacterium]|nr:DUF6311 domain-containing protein [Polyangiaceae bacterium]